MRNLIHDPRLALAASFVVIGFSSGAGRLQAETAGTICVHQVNDTVCYFGGKDCDTLICCDNGNPTHSCDA